jgi:hypothetical protein
MELFFLRINNNAKKTAVGALAGKMKSKTKRQCQANLDFTQAQT